MSCTVNYDILKQYPEVVTAIYMSSAQEGFNRTSDEIDSYITNNEKGYIIELEKTGQASAKIGSANDNELGNMPYSTKLRAVTDLSEILKAQKVLIEKAEFYAYDTLKEGSVHQNQDVYNTIIASRTDTRIIPQSYVLNSFAPNFLPNFFRPLVMVNNINLIKGLQSSNYGEKKNIGDMSIGLPLPYCIDIYREFGKVSDISAYAQMCQIIDVDSPQGWLAQRYAIQMILTIRCGSGTVEFKN